MTIPPYMQGPYNKCYQLGWFTPDLVTNAEFIDIFKKACNSHQGKGDHARYARKVMEKFSIESLDGSTITPLHNGLNSLFIPRKNAKVAREKAAVVAAFVKAAEAARQREAEINRLKIELANVNKALTAASQVLNNYKASLDNNQKMLVKLNAEIIAERAAKQSLEKKVTQLSQELQASQANVSELAKQLGAASVASQASTARLEQKFTELNQLTSTVVRLREESSHQSASLAALQQNQINTNRLLAQLLQAALG